MPGETEQNPGQSAADRFDETLRQRLDFAAALKRVKEAQELIQQFEPAPKRVSIRTQGQWKPSRLAVPSPQTR
jgi:thioredoxin-like negative regulator of GroEL